MEPEGTTEYTGAAAAQNAGEESEPRLEPISPVNPQRPTERRELIALARQSDEAARQRRRAATG